MSAELAAKIALVEEAADRLPVELFDTCRKRMIEGDAEHGEGFFDLDHCGEAREEIADTVDYLLAEYHKRPTRHLNHCIDCLVAAWVELEGHVKL